MIQNAIQSRRERDVKDAMKQAKAAGFIGVTKDSSKFVTDEVKKVVIINLSRVALNILLLAS